MLTVVAMLLLAGDVSQTNPTLPPYTPSPSNATSPSTDLATTTYTRIVHSYPWKKGVVTTIFWIGQGSKTASAWDKNWVSSNGGADSPTDRQAYLPADHVPTVNPFYVALPFNDLTCPEKARHWLPEGWERQPRDGKPVSACKDRWVEIKNQQGEVCFAQWEDVGPLRDDDAEYVFGNEPPGPDPGLDVSPAVATYLKLDNNKKSITSWRFVDPENLPPGYWLKYDEEALIYSALHQQAKNSSGATQAETDHSNPTTASSKKSPPASSPAGPAIEGDVP